MKALTALYSMSDPPLGMGLYFKSFSRNEKTSFASCAALTPFRARAQPELVAAHADMKEEKVSSVSENREVSLLLMLTPQP